MDFGRIMERDGFSSLEQLIYTAAMQYRNESMQDSDKEQSHEKAEV